MSLGDTHACYVSGTGGLGGWDGDVTIWAVCWGGGRGSQLQPAVWKPAGDTSCFLSSWLGTWEHAPSWNLPKSLAPGLEAPPPVFTQPPGLILGCQQAQAGQHRAEA